MDEDLETQSSVYPNLFEEIINVDPTGDLKIKQIFMNVASGKAVGVSNWDGTSINLKGLSPGVFWMKIIYENGQEEIHRLVKTK